MLESIKSCTYNTLLAIQKPFSFIYSCGEWIDRKIEDCLPRRVALTAKIALHLFPYIGAAFFLPPVPALCVTSCLFAFKAIATFEGKIENTYFDIGGPLVGGGAFMGIIAAKKFSLLWPTTRLGYAIPSFFAGAALLISIGLIQLIYENSDKPSRTALGN